MPQTASAAVQTIPVELIERKIYTIRGAKVMLDSDLADLYQVPTKVLNQAVRRNLDRFPADFMFQLTEEEVENLRSQIVTSSTGHGGRRYQPYAFTEHGVAMLSSVLASKRAISLNILIIRAFVRLREYLATQKTWRGSWKMSNVLSTRMALTSSRFTTISDGSSSLRNLQNAASASEDRNSLKAAAYRPTRVNCPQPTKPPGSRLPSTRSSSIAALCREKPS
jgi:hypothetical protein